MTKVVIDISMSLDGFITASGITPDEPLGDGGERLHEWAFGKDDRDRAILAEAGGDTGAIITGRTTYDASIPWWGADGPSGSARLPVFVLSHARPADVPADAVYTFVEGGIEEALAEARAVAGDKTVCVMGGAETARQYLGAGLVDELSIHLVPVLFGSGTPLFEPEGEQVPLENVEAVQTPAATHLRFRVIHPEGSR